MADDLKFEKAMQKLEKIVEELEAGNIPLDDAVKRYEEGVKLSGACQKKLQEAEKKIEVLSRSATGSFETEAFEYEGTKKAKKSSAKKTSEDEEFLI